MSLFDRPYYTVTKAYMSRIGIWPEQSKYVRIILPLTMFAITLTLYGPMLIRLRDAWRDINILARSTTILLIGIGVFFILFSTIQHFDSIKVSLMNIVEHWDRFKNTPAVIILEKYAEQGRYIIVVYSTCVYVAATLCYVLCLSPTIFDFIDPVNESRSKIYFIEAEYGVDADKYYCFIISHTYVVMMTVLSIMIGIEALFILEVLHTFALFEVVGFKLERIANKYSVNKENVITLRSDWTYKNICDCILLHTEAISFADRIEDISSGIMGVALGIIAIITIMSAVQALINWKHPEVLMQQVILIIGHVIHLYIISIPGQELMNRSRKIHTTAYNFGWQDMPVNAQKLLIPILVRSNKPCYFTAGKVYVLSMETFGSVLRTMISYFTIFAQMI